MKVKEFLKPFTDTSLFRLRGDLYTVKHLKSSFGDFEVVTANNDYPDRGIVTIVIDEPICDCYNVTKERRYLTEYEKGYHYGRYNEEIEYVTKEVPRCLGTKEWEICTCGGYRSQCNFYREKFMKDLEDEEKSK